MALALSASQAFSYNVSDLQKIERGTAALATAHALAHAVLQDGANENLKMVGDVSNEVNRLVAYAIEDQSFMVRVTRVINNLSDKAAWQKAEAINGAFLKNFSVELTHGVATEVASYFKGKALDAVVPSISDSRVVSRAANVLATAIITSLLETTFMHVNHALELPGAAEKGQCVDKLVGTFFSTLFAEAAYNFAGEAILCGASDAKADWLNSVFASNNAN